MFVWAGDPSTLPYCARLFDGRTRAGLGMPACMLPPNLSPDRVLAAFSTFLLRLRMMTPLKAVRGVGYQQG